MREEEKHGGMLHLAIKMNRKLMRTNLPIYAFSKEVYPIFWKRTHLMVPAMPALSHLTTSRQSPSVDSLQLETVVHTVGKSLVWALGTVIHTVRTVIHTGRTIIQYTHCWDSLVKAELLGDSLVKGYL